MLLTSHLHKVISHKYLVLALLLTIIVSSPGLHNGWVNRDDPQYVLNNELIQQGFTDQFGKIWTKQVMGNYHPITMLSIKLDQVIWGNNPLGYHATGILFHLVNVLLSYIFFYMLTGSRFSAGLIAMLFGIHPMHVESVAWISARKDVLYVAFLLVGLIFWVLHIRDTGSKNYRKFSFIAFVLSILCKPVAVVFPLLLLLIDYKEKRALSLNLLKEKSAFFALSLLSGILTLATQKASGALDAIDTPSLLEKLTIASYGLSNYLFKLIVPIQLSAHHPNPNLESGFPLFYLLSTIVAVILIGLIWKFRHNHSITFGIGVFLVSIGPVLQLLTFGDAVLAERYTYFAYFGLFYLITLGLDKLREGASAIAKNTALLFVTGAIFYFSVISYDRYSIWKNSETLWSDVIEKYPDDYLAYGTRANFYMSQGNLDAALVDYDKSIELNPKFVGTLINRGQIYRLQGRTQAAMNDFNQVILLAPSTGAYLNRGLLFKDTKAHDMALSDLSHAIVLDPLNAQAYLERGLLQTRLKAYAAAITDYTTTIELQPTHRTAYFYRGDAYCLMNELELGIEDFSMVIQLNPDDGRAFFFRSRAYEAMGDLIKAKKDAVQAANLGYVTP